MRIKGLIAATSVAMAAGAAVLVPAGSAAADDGSATCVSGDVCIYYNSGPAGAHRGWGGWVNNYGNDGYAGGIAWHYPNNGAGYTQAMKNNAGSAANLDYGYKAIIWENSFPYGGSPSGRGDVLNPRTTYEKLGLTYNNNASHTWVKA
ncbi:hypothetical protein ACFQLX_07715 [Streptomyces polyrhachis]|uniref:Peptidase inhibitor family I36 n=1 Tax=Streptomyces polyrhachis TaxID=1282885 RepID=A0ABW2GGA5_9ACTN